MKNSLHNPLYNHNILRILRLLRLLLICNGITPSKDQTKAWRLAQPWYIDGRRNECEKYQRRQIELITQKTCHKTKERINTETNEIIEEARPMTRINAFYWTEDFDGKHDINGFILRYNLKMVCDSGGAQTRTLREVAHYIISQLDYKIKYIHKCEYFVNILDGDTSFSLYDQYNHILNKEKYKYVKNFVFVGDMYSFVKWFHRLNAR